MKSTQIKNELNTYLVGGAVRDMLLKRKVVERDYVVIGSTTEKMIALGFEQVGKDFPVFLHPKTKAEYALARTERKQGVGYTGFVCHASPDITLEQDLLRRDLTVNAMAMDDNGNIIDPYHGQDDLNNKILRHVSPAFSEDPLRVLRVARFAARYHYLGFSVAKETLQLMTDISQSGEISTLSAERVWQEMQRSLSESNPEVFFQRLHQCQALARIAPELDALWGKYTMRILQQAVHLTPTEPSRNPASIMSIRFAALCHNLGVDSVKHICQQLKTPNQVKSLTLKVCEFHLSCHEAIELKPKAILTLFNQLDIWRKPAELEDFLLTCKAVFLGNTNNECENYPQADYLKKLANATKNISAKTFVEQGLKGLAIKEAMQQARLEIITKLK
jgi:tRNA nucleotidyltransferase (CCA-adding enzyme)